MQLTNDFPNYCCTVIRINKLLKLEGLDNLLGLPIYGYQALVSKKMEIGQLCLLFTAETELDADYCQNNNLYRHSEKNIDKKTIAYIEDTRRIRVIKLRNNISSALIMPLNSLDYLGINSDELKEGDCFTGIDNKPICKKYVVVSTRNSSMRSPKNKEQAFTRIDTKLFPEHIDTSNWNKYKEDIDKDTRIIVTAKLHGTSVRLTHQLSNRKLSWIEKILVKIGVKIQNQEYDYFSASRRVIKQFPDDGFYRKDVWAESLDRCKFAIPKGWVIFGELIGWAGDKAIQKNYTYQIPQGAMELYVYRITFCNPDGLAVDLSWEAIKHWCYLNGIKHVPELAAGRFQDIDTGEYMNKKLRADLGLENCPPLDDNAPCDEGVVIRIERGYNAAFYKNKSPEFLVHETKAIDSGEEQSE